MAEIQDEENYNYRSIIQIIYNNIKLLSFAQWKMMKIIELVIWRKRSDIMCVFFGVRAAVGTC